MAESTCPITVDYTQGQYRVLATAARVRGLTPSGLLQLLGEAFVASQTLPAARPAGPGRQAGDSADRIAYALAARVQRDGAMTVGQAWRHLSGRDRSHGRELFAEALARGQAQQLFVVDDDQLTVPPATEP